MVRFGNYSLVSLSILINLFFFASANLFAAEQPGSAQCRPTAPDEIGPFYLPDAPLRNVVGSGYVIEGTARQYPSCQPLAGAKIEFWHAGPSGSYEARYRGITFSDAKGRYRIETDPPGSYGNRPPHVHFYVTAPGFEPLITQLYPRYPSMQADFDLVLLPEAK